MKRTYKRIAYNILVIIIMLAGIGVVISRFAHFGNVEYTDNATVQQHITPINNRVQGFIKEIRFEDYQHVKKGDTLVIIDDAECRLRLAQAEADRENALAGHRVADAGVRTTQSNISVSDDAIELARIQLENAEREDNRYASLLAEDAVTQQHNTTESTPNILRQRRNTSR